VRARSLAPLYKLLVAAGADPDIRVPRAGNAVTAFVATFPYAMSMKQSLWDSGRRAGVEFATEVAPDYAEALHALLDVPAGRKRPSVNVPAEYGRTPLYMASRARSWEAVTALLAAGADVNARAVHGATCLQIAHVGGLFREVAPALLAAGAKDVPARCEWHRHGAAGVAGCARTRSHAG
jgi:hypothetical protein